MLRVISGPLSFDVIQFAVSPLWYTVGFAEINCRVVYAAVRYGHSFRMVDMMELLMELSNGYRVQGMFLRYSSVG